MEPGKEEQDKDENKDFPQGVHARLLQLELGARGAARAQELRRRRERLQRRSRELQERRERLRERLERARQGNLGIPSDPDPREVLEWKIRKCRDLLRLFQLTGLSGRLSPRGVSFSFHAAFEGSLLGSFQLELQPFPKFPEFRILRHSIPPFIPLESLARQFLPRRPREFLGILFQHLNAFEGRRHQLEKFQEEFSECLQDVPGRNSLCNLLTFRYRLPAGNSREIPEFPEDPAEGIPAKNPQNVPEFREFQARLLYRDPLRSHPSDVDVSACGGAAAPPEHSELFRSLSLPAAARELRQPRE